MTQPDAARAPERSSTPAPLSRRLPVHPWAWLLRTGAITAFFAAVTGVLVAPGLRGLAADRIVDRTNTVAWTLAYFLSGLLIAAIVGAARELSRDARTQGLANGFAVSAAGLVVALAAPAFVHALPPLMSAAMAAVSSAVVITASVRGLRVAHTRAVSALMLSMALAGALRVIAWKMAEHAGDAGDTGLYAVSRGAATVALGLEAVGQMIAAAWLGTRSRLAGQVLSSVAIGLAWVLTWGSAQGASATAKPWEAAAHIALATAGGLPRPYGWTALAPFLLAASVLLGGVAAVQRGVTAPILFALTLSLIARGTLDVPLHALAAVAAALWVTLAVSDPRAMWESLLASRGRSGEGPTAPYPPSTPPSPAAGT